MNPVFTIIAILSTLPVTSSECFASSCAELLLQGNTQSGIYTIHPRSWYSVYPFQVYCDMETDGGGWTLLQKREDYEPRENFFRNWQDYKIGFGDLNKEFWLGNDYIHILTNQDRVSMRMDLEDFENNTRIAEYGLFQVSNESDNYRLIISEHHGTAGDGLNHPAQNTNHSVFSTKDKNKIECANNFKGGWWYVACHNTNPNGVYHKGIHTSYADGVNYSPWRGEQYSLKRIEIKVRPVHFKPYSQIQLV